jgi:gamma-glutamyl hercynylcysteine S-oxide synthase
MFGTARVTENTSLYNRLCDARRLTDDLFSVLRTDALYERPIPERHRLIFYLGHLEAFDWNLFRHRYSQLRSPQPAFDHVFAFGIDPVDGGLPTDQPKDWPSVAEVRCYNQGTRQQLDALFETGELDANITPSPDSESTLLHVAIEHRLMHAETLAYLFHRMPYSQKVGQQQSLVAAREARLQTIVIAAGTATLGLSRDSGVFGWDNEFDIHQVQVPEFHIDKFMVTNGEFLQFVLDGGYDRRTLWKDADWEWIHSHQIHQPAFWQRQGTQWVWRGMFEEIELPLDWPVYVSHAEASAYAQWAGKSLPTEAQWHRAAYGAPGETEREYPWGYDPPTPDQGNFGFSRWDPSPVNSLSENSSAFGVTGMLGNGWEWATSEFAPFPGFTPFPFYQGYSANFFDGQHFVLKGGSSRTAFSMLRRSFRNWFQPHYQYAYTGFRCVSNSASREQSS